MTNPMFASIRKYNGSPLMSDELIRHQDAIKSALRPIRGLHAFYMVKTTDGVMSVAVCNDKTGADDANRVEATWLKDKLPTFTNRAPEVSTGEVLIQLEAELVKVAV